MGSQFVRAAIVAIWLSTAAHAADPATRPATQPSESSNGLAKLLLALDFEGTPAGAIPDGFTKTGPLGVVEDVAHSGKKSLRIEPADRGPRRITLSGDVVKSLGGQHWGRLYFKVQLPTPVPTGAGNFPVIHSTIVSMTAQSPLQHDAIEVRTLDTVLGPNGTHQFIYNVQPKSRREFGKGSAYTHHYTDQWTLAEWYVDYATQTYRLFINGAEINDVAVTNGAGNFARSEIPETIETISFGWNNYQSAGKGFTVWIDNIALAKDRIGRQ